MISSTSRITCSSQPIKGLNNMVEFITINTKTEDILYYYFTPKNFYSKMLKNKEDEQICRINYQGMIINIDPNIDFPYDETFKEIYSNHMMMRKKINTNYTNENINNNLYYSTPKNIITDLSTFTVLSDDDIINLRTTFTNAIIPSSALFRDIATLKEVNEYNNIENSVLAKIIPPQFRKKVIAAGGSIVDHILGDKPRDYDMFFTSEENLTEYYNMLITHEDYNVTHLTSSSLAHTITLVEKHKRNDEYNSLLVVLDTLKSLYPNNVKDNPIIISTKTQLKTLKQEINNTKIVVQLITKLLYNVQDVIISFDLPSCAVMYYDSKIYASDRFLYTMRNRFQYIDPTLISDNFMVRLQKYSNKGIAVLVPDFDPVEWLNNNPTHETAIMINNNIKINKRRRHYNNLGYLTYLHFCKDDDKNNNPPSDYDISQCSSKKISTIIKDLKTYNIHHIFKSKSTTRYIW